MMIDTIILAPGSRARLIINKGGMGEDVALFDVSNPYRERNDDGSEGAVNTRPWYVLCMWFPSEALAQMWFADVAAHAVEEEREACAQIIDKKIAIYEREGNLTLYWLFKHAADEIRARSGP